MDTYLEMSEETILKIDKNNVDEKFDFVNTKLVIIMPVMSGVFVKKNTKQNRISLVKMINIYKDCIEKNKLIEEKNKLIEEKNTLIEEKNTLIQSLTTRLSDEKEVSESLKVDLLNKKKQLLMVAFTVGKITREKILNVKYGVDAFTIYNKRQFGDNPDIHNASVKCSSCKKYVSLQARENKCSCGKVCAQITKYNKMQTHDIQKKNSEILVFQTFKHFKRCDKNTDTYCQALYSNCQTDHGIPLGNGGTHHIRNMYPLQQCCNGAKGDGFLLDEIHRYVIQNFEERYHKLVVYTVCFISKYLILIPDVILVIFEDIDKKRIGGTKNTNFSVNNQAYIKLLDTSPTNKVSDNDMKKVNRLIRKFDQPKLDMLGYFTKIMVNTYRLHHDEYLEYLIKTVNKTFAKSIAI